MDASISHIECANHIVSESKERQNHAIVHMWNFMDELILIVLLAPGSWTLEIFKPVPINLIKANNLNCVGKKALELKNTSIAKDTLNWVFC